VYLCVLCGSENKQRLFPCAAFIALEALRYKPKGGGFYSRRCHRDFSLRVSSSHHMAKWSTQAVTEMSKEKWSRYRPGVAQRVGRGIALLFHERGTRRGWVVSSTTRPHFTPGKDPVPISQKAGWAPGLVWTGGKSRSHRDLIPDRPARSQSLYRLSYPAQNRNEYQEYFLMGKGGRSLGLTNWTYSSADCPKIWEPQPPGNLRVCAGL